MNKFGYDRFMVDPEKTLLNSVFHGKITGEVIVETKALVFRIDSVAPLANNIVLEAFNKFETIFAIGIESNDLRIHWGAFAANERACKQRTHAKGDGLTGYELYKLTATEIHRLFDKDKWEFWQGCIYILETL